MKLYATVETFSSQDVRQDCTNDDTSSKIE